VAKTSSSFFSSWISLKTYLKQGDKIIRPDNRKKDAVLGVQELGVDFLGLEVALANHEDLSRHSTRGRGLGR